MSQSSRPTRLPSEAIRLEIVQARLEENVDLPTPPLPLATAMTCLTPGIPAGVACVPGASAFLAGFMETFISVELTSGNSVRVPSMSSRIWAATLWSLEVTEIPITAFPSLKSMDRTSPKDTMSRLNPGYLTVANAFLIASWLTAGCWFDLYSNFF